MSTQTAVERLRTLLPPENLITNAAGAVAFATSLGAEPGFPPLAVALPETVEQAAGVMAAAHSGGLSVIIRGGASSLAQFRPAGTSGTQSRNRIVLSTAKLRRVIEVDEVSRVAHVQSGVTIDRLRHVVAPYQLSIPSVDHGAHSVATIGGTIANDSLTPSGLMPVALTDDVLGVIVVMPDGQSVRVGGPVMDCPPMSHPALFASVCRAGGLIVEAWISLRPAPPARRELAALWTDWSRAIDATLQIAQGAALVQSAFVCNAALGGGRLEGLTDQTKKAGDGSETAATLMTVAGHADDVRGVAEELESALRTAGAGHVRLSDDVAAGPAEPAAAYVNRSLYLASRPGPNRQVIDISVAPLGAADCHAAIRQIAREHGASFQALVHARQGLLLCVFETEGGSRSAAETDRLLAAIAAKVNDLGGSIAALHGRSRFGSDLPGLAAERLQSSLEGDVTRALMQANRRFGVGASAASTPGDAAGRLA